MPDSPRALPPRPLCVDRVEELKQIREWQADAMVSHEGFLLAVTGGPGMGKSTLLLTLGYELARDYPHGVLYCEALEDDPILESSAHDLAGRLLVQLGVAWGDIPERSKPRFDLLRTKISRRKLLILIDDVRSAGQVLPLLGDVSRAAVIVSSGKLLERLIINRFRSLELPELDDEHAVELLTEFAGSVIEQTSPAVLARICALCAGSPMRLAMVGAQLAHEVESPQQVVAWLEQQALAAGNDSEGVSVMAAVCDAGYRTLDPGQAQAYRWLSLLPGPHFGLSAAVAALTMPEREVERILRGLIERKLLEEKGDSRFRFHRTVREHAAALARAVDSAQARRSVEVRVIQWTARRAVGLAKSISERPVFGAVAGPFHERLAPLFRGPSATETASAEFDLDWPNFVAAVTRALDIGEQQLAIVLLTALWPFGYRAARTAELVDGYLRVSDCAEDHGTRMQLLRDLAGLHEKRDAQEEALQYLRMALDTGFAPGTASVLEWWALCSEGQGRLDEALAKLTEAQEALGLLSNTAIEERSMALLRMHRGRIQRKSGRFAEAVTEFAAAEKYFRASDRDIHNAALCRNLLGDLALQQGMPDEARARWEDALDVLLRHLMRGDAAGIHDKLAELAQGQQRYDDAETHRAAARELREGSA